MAKILGYGLTRVERHYDKGVRELAAEATEKALEHSGIENVDFIVVASSLSYLQEPQLDIAGYLASFLGLRGARSFAVEAGESSGAAALQVAKSLIDSGHASTVLVVGIDKLTDYPSQETYRHLQLLYDTYSDAFYNIGHAGIAGILMRLYMKAYGVSREILSYWPSMMHSHGSSNPYAMLRFRVDPSKVHSSAPLAEPVTLMDAYPLGDGAAAIVMSSSEGPRAGDPAAELVRIESSTGFPSPALSDDPLKIDSLAASMSRLGISPRDLGNVDVMEIHDSFTITGLLILETLGLADRGKAPESVAEGRFTVGGDGPLVNPSGGLKSRGHPIGATDVYKAAEIVMQLDGSFPGVKAQDARLGLLVSVNGFGSSSYVGLFKSV
ncbi:MAG: thiolase family protein [Desulfurococcales archaeon]|nr:thiolase family protein [Desulfurococcales archaeon]